ncbi:MAG: hypothetical protein J6A75_13335 [Lachnospiraceae bacterium]|nr:hypothetical protein [Lachnospiraceae bacterium]
MEKEKIEKLYELMYELLEVAEKNEDTESVGALRYAIFALGNTQDKSYNLEFEAYKLLLFEVDAMDYKSQEEKLTISEWKKMNERLQKAYDDKLITKQQLLHLISLMTNYHCIEG